MLTTELRELILGFFRLLLCSIDSFIEKLHKERLCLLVHIRLHEEEVVDDSLRDPLCLLRAFSACRHLDKVCAFGILDIKHTFRKFLCRRFLFCIKVNTVDDRIKYGT